MSRKLQKISKMKREKMKREIKLIQFDDWALLIYETGWVQLDALKFFFFHKYGLLMNRC